MIISSFDGYNLHNPHTPLPFLEARSAMKRSLLWLAALPLLSVLALPTTAANEKKAVAGEKVFGTAKVVQFHLTMDEKQFEKLTPKDAGKGGFGFGFGQPRKQE